MADLHETLRAVVDAVVPEAGPGPGGLEVGADHLLASIAQRMGAETGATLVMLLDGYASAVRDGCAFAHLDVAERQDVIRTIASGEEQVAQAARLLVSLTMAGVYGEWSGLEGATLARHPASWDVVGYPGPSTGYDLDRSAPSPDA